MSSEKLPCDRPLTKSWIRSCDLTAITPSALCIPMPAASSDADVSCMQILA